MTKYLTMALLALATLITGCTRIDTGNVGVERTMGKVSLEELPQGVYQTIFKNVDEYTTKEVVIEMRDMKPKSQDNLTMQDIDIDVYYRVEPGKVADLFIKYQGDVQELRNGDLAVAYNRVLREAREVSYKAVSKFPATTMHTKRDELIDTIRSMLQEELEKFDPKAFIVTNVNLRSLVTDAAIEEAIRKQVAMDQQIAAKVKENELAKAEAARLLIDASGQAEANRKLNESITPALLRLKEIEAMQAVAAKNGNTTIVLPAGSGAPLMTMPVGK